jgi:signal transduction histidine kinase
MRFSVGATSRGRAEFFPQGFAGLALRHGQQSAGGRREANRLIAQKAERMGLLVDDLQLLARLDQEPSYRREPWKENGSRSPNCSEP